MLASKIVGWFLGFAAVAALASAARGDELTEVAKIVAGMTPYKSATYTQRIATTDNRPSVLGIPRARLDRRWQVSGGMEGYSGWASLLFKSGPAPEVRLERIPVLNSFGHYQNELGYTRKYRDGARFVDVLLTARGIFEVRVRERESGTWFSNVEYVNDGARPLGYKGLLVSCTFCHRQTGTGEYGEGLIPGGDGVFSEPFDALESAP